LEELENLRLSLSLSEGVDFQSNSAFEISDLELEMTSWAGTKICSSKNRSLSLVKDEKEDLLFIFEQRTDLFFVFSQRRMVT
jgi:hypothetical protein